MAKVKTSYQCSECGWQSSKWLGQCRNCKAWGTLEESVPAEESAPSRNKIAGKTPRNKALPISEVDITDARFIPTGIGELDRVLGGGLVAGSVVLLAGEPGVGKSTLLLDVAGKVASTWSNKSVLYITGEESAAQVRLRAERIGALTDNLLLAAETELESVLGHIDQCSPSLVIADSVQTIASGQVSGQAGNVTQVRAVCSALIEVAKSRGIPILLVGHVTKSGGIAGPRVLEHLVDVVTQFEGDRHTRLRLLRAVKNRYGATDEVGCFELVEKGIIGLADPSGLFLSQTSSRVPGTCVTVTLEGRRPMPTEIQALVSPLVSGGSARRTTSGLDYSRVAMTLAVLQARLRLALSQCDVYVSTVGGAKTSEPAVDLAVALAITSATQSRPPLEKMVAIGEVSLTGEIRATVGVGQRLSEAARLGFRHALIPRLGADEVTAPKGMKLHPVTNLAEAVMIALPEGEATSK